MPEERKDYWSKRKLREQSLTEGGSDFKPLHIEETRDDLLKGPDLSRAQKHATEAL